MAAFSPGIFPPNDFWDFAVRLYGATSVRESCLTLQDRDGLDVNIVLFCCWLGESGRGVFRPGELETAIERVAAWRGNVVEVLRRLRRTLTEGVAGTPRLHAEDLRRVIAESELHAEHVAALMLRDCIERVDGGSSERMQQLEHCAANLRRYLALTGTGSAALTESVRILGRVFQEAPSAHIVALCHADPVAAPPEQM